MPKRKASKADGEGSQAARERELRDLIEQAEAKKSGNTPPEKESPHDFVERRMRIRPKPGDVK